MGEKNERGKKPSRNLPAPEGDRPYHEKRESRSQQRRAGTAMDFRRKLGRKRKEGKGIAKKKIAAPGGDRKGPPMAGGREARMKKASSFQPGINEPGEKKGYFRQRESYYLEELDTTGNLVR